MTMRLQEVHPSLVHAPITLLPLAVGADLLGRLTGSRSLMELGRTMMPIAAASSAVAALFGLIAQSEVAVEPGTDAHDALVTHRNLNLTLVATATALAAWRARADEPSPAYLAIGLAGLGALSYSAYLGGHMVYEHGIGVRPADGLADGDAPEVRPGNFGEAARASVRDLQKAIPQVVEDFSRGDILPTLGVGGGRSRAAATDASGDDASGGAPAGPDGMIG